jgi:hypothetical protein
VCDFDGLRKLVEELKPLDPMDLKPSDSASYAFRKARMDEWDKFKNAVDIWIASQNREGK